MLDDPDGGLTGTGRHRRPEDIVDVGPLAGDDLDVEGYRDDGGRILDRLLVADAVDPGRVVEIGACSAAIRAPPSLRAR
ncbi:MAG: hypothetical protein R3D25_10135 [Geminicoccaceae bacterium]